MWILQAASQGCRQVTLVAGMNSQNTAVDVFFVTGKLENSSKINIDERHEWLQKGTRLEGLQSFLDVVMTRRCERKRLDED